MRTLSPGKCADNHSFPPFREYDMASGGKRQCRRGEGRRPVIRLRIPRKDDASITRIIRKELLPYARESFPDMVVTRKEIAKRLRHAVVFVSAEPGRAANGFISLFVRKRVLWVDMVALERGKQGKGLGKKLLERAELFGRSRRCRTMQLYVDRQNEGAQRFYDRCDYTMQEYVPLIRCFRYEKPLGDH